MLILNLDDISKQVDLDWKLIRLSELKKLFTT